MFSCSETKYDNISLNICSVKERPGPQLNSRVSPSRITLRMLQVRMGMTKSASISHCGQPTDFITPRVWFLFCLSQKNIFRLSELQPWKPRGCWPQSRSAHLVHSPCSPYVLNLLAGKPAVQIWGLLGALLVSHRKAWLAQRCFFGILWCNIDHTVVSHLVLLLASHDTPSRV